MTESFKQQLQELVDQAATHHRSLIARQDGGPDSFDMPNAVMAALNFKQGCEFLMSVLMKAIEQRDDAFNLWDCRSASFSEIEKETEESNEELLNILKGDR